MTTDIAVLLNAQITLGKELVKHPAVAGTMGMRRSAEQNYYRNGTLLVALGAPGFVELPLKHRARR